MTAKSAVEIYENAGKPYRAIIKFSEPTRIAKSRSKSELKTEVEAYLTLTSFGILAYYFNPSARFVWHVPSGVTEIIPVDHMELWRRAKIAAKYIIAGKIHGRELDSAFENHDGDEMCAALWRMAQRSPKLKAAICEQWSYTNAVRDTFIVNYDKFAHLSDKELSEHAKQTRQNKGVFNG